MGALIPLRRLLLSGVPQRGPLKQERLPLRMQQMLLPPTTNLLPSPTAWMYRPVPDVEAAVRANWGTGCWLPGYINQHRAASA